MISQIFAELDFIRISFIHAVSISNVYLPDQIYYHGPHRWSEVLSMCCRYVSKDCISINHIRANFDAL